MQAGIESVEDGRLRGARGGDEGLGGAAREGAMDRLDTMKREAALRALELVESGMLLGLGSGSTSAYFIRALGERLASGELHDVRGVATSRDSERLAQELGIPLVELEAEGVELAVDGMDEVTAGLDAIKGLGGALAREKIVAASARRFVLIGDERKRVARLGERSPVPVEVLAFGWRRTRAALERLGAVPAVRSARAEPYRTDNGNLILDCTFDHAFDPYELDLRIRRLPGVVEHGLFLHMAERAFIAGEREVVELVRGAS